MVTLLPWRWKHWVLLLVGPVFVVAYLTLLSWGPIDQAIHRLASHPGQMGGPQHHVITYAEAVFALTTLALLSPLVVAVALFLLLFALATLAALLGPVVRVLALSDWVVIPLLGALFSAALYATSKAWLPWSSWLVDRLTTIYVVLVQ